MTEEVEVRRVGPGGSMASDNAFAVALLGLWHRVAEAGGAVGFVPPVDRAAVGAAVADVIALIRSGRAVAYALTRKRDVIGFALLQLGSRTRSHTGEITSVMVDPLSQHRGLGRIVLQALIDLAPSMGVERIRLAVPGGEGLERYFEPFGFVECGRSPDWIRVAPGDDRAEVLMIAQVRSR